MHEKITQVRLAQSSAIVSIQYTKKEIQCQKRRNKQLSMASIWLFAQFGKEIHLIWVFLKLLSCTRFLKAGFGG